MKTLHLNSNNVILESDLIFILQDGEQSLHVQEIQSGQCGGWDGLQQARAEAGQTAPSHRLKRHGVEITENNITIRIYLENKLSIT